MKNVSRLLLIIAVVGAFFTGRLAGDSDLKLYLWVTAIGTLLSVFLIDRFCLGTWLARRGPGLQRTIRRRQQREDGYTSRKLGHEF